MLDPELDPIEDLGAGSSPQFGAVCVSTMDGPPQKASKGPHWARYCHHTENPMQVAEAPVSTRPRTGMPSRLSWPVMGGPTEHTTGVTLASGDLSNRFSCTLGPGWESSLAVGGFRIGPWGGSRGLAHACCRRRCWREGRAGQLALHVPPRRKGSSVVDGDPFGDEEGGDGSFYPHSRGWRGVSEQ